MSIFSIAVFVFVILMLLLVVAMLGVMAWFAIRDGAKWFAAFLITMSAVLVGCTSTIGYDAVVKGEWCWSGRWESTYVPVSEHESIRSRPGCVVPRQ